MTYSSDWSRKPPGWLRLGVLLAGTFGSLVACSNPQGPRESIATTAEALVTLTGTVTDQGGDPIPDVEVTLLDSFGDKIGAGISGADGSYVIVPSGTDIPDGSYDVVVTPPGGSIFVPQTFSSQAFNGTSTFDIVLVSGVSVTGRLVDSGGSGLSGYNVCLDNLCAVSGIDGDFALSVANGSRYLRVEGYANLPIGFRYLWLQKNTPVVVNGSLALGDVTLQTRRLTGTVLDAGSNPVAGAMVGSWNSTFSASFGDFSGYWYGYTLSEADGTFSLPVLLGSGTISATASGHPSAAVAVSITDDVDVTLNLVGNVTGRVVDSGGSGLGNRTVCFYPNSGGSTCAPTQADGSFAFGLANGSYQFNFQGSLSSSGSTYTYLNKNTPIAVSGVTALGDIVIETRTLSGLVRDSALQPVVGASAGNNNHVVTASFGDFSGYWYGSATTGSDGRFSITVAPSSGTIVANATGQPSAFQAVTIAGTNVDVTLDLLPKVTGRLVDSLGAGLGNSTWCAQISSSNAGCLTTAGDGSFAFNAADGSYSTYLTTSLNTSSGWRYAFFQKQSPVTVSGTTAFGNITLQSRILAGRVVDVDGFPVAGVQVGNDQQVLSASFADYSGYWYGLTNTGTDGRFSMSVFPSSGTLNFRPTAASGLAPFGISNFQIVNDRMLGVSVQFLRDIASAFVIASGSLSTDNGGDGASPSDPVDTTVTLSNIAGTVTIEEMPLEVAPPFGYRYLTQQINITAPGSTDETQPLVIVFRIDCTRFAPAACDQTTANSVILFRNGVQLDEGCPALGTGDALDYPCVANRGIVGDDVEITVHTLSASTWTFALKLDDDADGDRIVDADDACPNDPEDVDGNEDTDGCPEFDDADGDGIEDAVDLCPDVAEDLDGNDDSDGCPEIEDTDGDGLDDSVDACPNEPEDVDGNADDDGCPEADDADGDGIPDATDACPSEPEDMDGNADTDGCPETEPPPVKCADVNGDGRVTRRDVEAIRDRLGTREGQRRYRSRYDLNSDGRITWADVLLARKQLGTRC